MIVESVCLLVVCISEAPMAVLYNFIALGIVAEFDNVIYEALHNPLKELLEESSELLAV